MNLNLSRTAAGKMFLSFLLTVIASVLYGQNVNLRPVSSTYVLKEVTVVTSPGSVIENATVIIKDGLIHAVGTDVAVPVDAIPVEADSMMVYAGFISGLTHAGVPKPKEDNSRRRDIKDPGNPPNDLAGITPEYEVRTLVDPAENSIDALRKVGFTMTHSVPYGSVMPGQGAILLLKDGAADDLVYREGVSMFGTLDGNRGTYPATVIAVMAKYRQVYRQAEISKKESVTYSNNPAGMKKPVTSRVHEAFYPVIDKSLPMMFHTESKNDVYRAMTLQKDLGFNLMLGGVKQGWDLTDKIKSANIPVFMSLDLPEWKEEKKDSTKEEEPNPEEEALLKRKKESLTNYYTLPATWSAAGIRFGFSTLEAKESDIQKAFAKMKELGVSEDVLLAGLTTQPAALLGLSRVAGTVEKGKLANLVVTDKNFFDEDAKVRFVFVDGEVFEYDSKPKKKSTGSGGDPSGTWSYTATTPQGSGTGVVEITGTSGNYSGTITVSESNQTFDLTNVQYSEGELSFDFVFSDGSNSVPMSASVMIDKDSFTGTVDGGQIGSFPITGERTPN